MADQQGLSSQAATKRQNRANQSTIADAVKQFVLIIISLGFSSAFGILTKAVADKLPHIYSHVCFVYDPTCQGFNLANLLVFAIYVLVGTRFLLTNWLYLTATYQNDNNKELVMWPDAVGTSLTGILIAIQSSYAAWVTVSDFFWWFLAILGIDVFFSVISLAVHWRTPGSKDWRREGLSMANNVIFGLLSLRVLVSSRDSGWLIFIAFLNSMVSFAISYRGYFRTWRSMKAG
jgi:hypothetical protein